VITMQDIDSAIAECQGARDPDARCVTLLAALYTVKDHMSAPAERREEAFAFSTAPARDIIRYMSTTPFGRAIYGRQANDVWLLMDDLMTAVKTQNPRLYDSIMRQL